MKVIKFKENRIRALTIMVALQFLIIIYQGISASKKPKKCEINSEFSEKYNLKNIKRWTDLFYQIGKKHGTDKVSGHSYHNLYGMYLGPRRFENIKLLEIGLGCNMDYGPGKSLLTWREFAPNAHITVLEYDAKCAKALKTQVDQLFTGDQSDFDVLETVSSGGPYDIIIDDGGHTRKQQIFSLIGLWPTVRSGGGVYVIEDMQCTYENSYMDYNISTYDMVTQMLYLFLDKKGEIENPLGWNISKEFRSVWSSVLSINCFEHSCVFVKK